MAKCSDGSPVFGLDNGVHFNLGIFEVTQEQWQVVMGINPSTFKKVPGIAPAEQAQFPVENVSWDNCQEFARRLNAMENEGGPWLYRLPSEAEWEYACRGGATTKEDCGFDYYLDQPTLNLRPEQANFVESKIGRPVPVGSYQPNRLGIYDLHGNVYEWCQDRFAPKSNNRVYRGGSWTSLVAYCQAAFRVSYPPSSARNLVGLRLARVLSPDGK